MTINANYCSTALEAVSLKSVKTCLGEWVGCAVNVIVDLFVVLLVSRFLALLTSAVPLDPPIHLFASTSATQC